MVLRSRFADVEIPDVPVPEFVLAASAGRSADTALVDGLSGQSISFGALAGHAANFGAALQERGLERGDVVAVISPNTVWYPVVFHGIAAAGGVSSPINSLYTPEEIAFQLRDSRAVVVVTIALFLERVREAVAQAPRVRRVVVLDADPTGESESLADLLRGAGPLTPVPLNPATDLVTLPYSSGTTGLPKGVRLSHRNLVANVVQCRPLTHFRAGDERVIAVLPFFHIYGLTVLMNQVLQWGGTVVSLPRFDLEQFLTAMQEYRVTRAFVAPPILLALAKHPMVDRYDLSSLRSITSGAAPLDAELAQAVQDRLRTKAGSADGPGVNVVQGYGMTELSPVSHTTPEDGLEPTGAGPTPKGTVGFALPNTECRLVDPATGQDAEVGELWVRGPQVMLGYLDNPEATAETIDAEGWLHTGDIASVDDQGRFTIVDRLKELIKYKGYQVAPAELEAVLVGHPDIGDAAVVGVPDAEAGELPKAFVVRRPGAELDEATVLAYVAQRVAPHKKVRQVEFIETIPKSPAGKILRRQLR